MSYQITVTVSYCLLVESDNYVKLNNSDTFHNLIIFQVCIIFPKILAFLQRLAFTAIIKSHASNVEKNVLKTKRQRGLSQPRLGFLYHISCDSTYKTNQVKQKSQHGERGNGCKSYLQTKAMGNWQLVEGESVLFKELAGQTVIQWRATHQEYMNIFWMGMEGVDVGEVEGGGQI